MECCIEAASPYKTIAPTPKAVQAAEEVTIARLQNGETIEFPLFSKKKMSALESVARCRDIQDKEMRQRPENSRENFNKKAALITAERRAVSYDPWFFDQAPVNADQFRHSGGLRCRLQSPSPYVSSAE